MPRWFLSTRAHSVGGPVAPLKVLDADRPGFIGNLLPELLSAIRGQEAFFGVHGFNVNQQNGIDHLTFWFKCLQIGNAVPIGVLWPGDCIIPIFVDYVVEGHEAIASGNLLAAFLNQNFGGAINLSFASHSLGARVVLQTISGLSRNVRRVVLMAGAIDNNCLIAEYRNAVAKIDQVSVLASTCDDVLKLAYPLGNPIQGIIDQAHPYYHAALGREGPAQPYPPAPRLQAEWQIPANLDYGHLDYLPGQSIPAAFQPPVSIPPATGPMPPSGTPAPLDNNPHLWKPAFSAGFASTRFK